MLFTELCEHASVPLCVTSEAYCRHVLRTLRNTPVNQGCLNKLFCLVAEVLPSYKENVLYEVARSQFDGYKGLYSC
jgi:hypothetical protein